MNSGLLKSAMVWVLIIITPATLMAADPGAMLHAKGPVLLNGNPVPANASAIFPGDSVETQPESAADINASGLGVVVLPDSLLKFEDNAIAVDHGGVSVVTSKSLVVRASDVTVTPVVAASTEFELTNVKGVIEVAARKADITVDCGNETLTLTPGQRIVRDQSGKCRRKKPAAYIPAAHNGMFNNPYFIVGGSIIGSVTVLCAILCATGSPPPVSPWQPSSTQSPQ